MYKREIKWVDGCSSREIMLLTKMISPVKHLLVSLLFSLSYYIIKIYFCINFSHLSELKNLYLHNNKIEKIENLTCLKNLSTLNLSSNAIGYLNPGSISCLPNLHTLLLSRNKLRTAEDIEELSNCSSEVTEIIETNISEME